MAAFRVAVAGMAGIAAWGLALMHAGSMLRMQEFSPGDMQLETTDETAGTQGMRLELKDVRPVNPDQFASPLTTGGVGLERIEPRPSLSIEPTKPPEPLRVTKPQTSEAGTIGFGERTIRLAGITATQSTMTCPSDTGAPWPCGMWARTQQRLFLRNRAIDCDLPNADWVGEKTAQCRLGNLDIATWLATNGWTVAQDGGPLAAATAEARAARRGIFGDDPR